MDDGIDIGVIVLGLDILVNLFVVLGVVIEGGAVLLSTLWLCFGDVVDMVLLLLVSLQ